MDWFDYILDETLRVNLGPPLPVIEEGASTPEDEATHRTEAVVLPVK